MFLPNPGIMAAGAGVAPPGQALITTSGSFIVPEGVFMICGVGIGHGGNQSDDAGLLLTGGGGGLAYSNDIPVTPGEMLSITITNTEAAVRRGGTIILRATSASDRIGGQGTHGQVLRAGGWGGYSSNLNFRATGASAAGYTTDGESGGERGTSGRAGQGTSLLGGAAAGAAGTAATVQEATYGGGAGRDVNRGLGGVRLIWGAGRAFPNTNTGDITA